jgi:hypothetical protein
MHPDSLRQVLKLAAYFYFILAARASARWVLGLISTPFP